MFGFGNWDEIWSLGLHFLELEDGKWNDGSLCIRRRNGLEIGIPLDSSYSI